MIEECNSSDNPLSSDLLPKKFDGDWKEQRDDVEVPDLTAYENHLNDLVSRIQPAIPFESPENIDMRPDWPPFFPVFKYDPMDVPSSERPFVVQAMSVWYLLAISIALNWLCCIILAFLERQSRYPVTMITLSSFYLFIITPIALYLGSIIVFKSFVAELSTSSFVKIGASLCAILIFEAFLFIGIDGFGSCGLDIMASLFSHGYIFTGILAGLVTSGLGSSAFLHARLLFGLWKYFKGSAQGDNIEYGMKKRLANVVFDSLN